MYADPFEEDAGEFLDNVDADEDPGDFLFDESAGGAGAAANSINSTIQDNLIGPHPEQTRNALALSALARAPLDLILQTTQTGNLGL